jgi:citrate synthase
MARESLSIRDNRTDEEYEVPISDGTINTMDLRQIKVDDEDFGLMGYDPGFKNTASCRSRITFIDGEKGILRYRGYPIEQLADKRSFLEVAYLLLYGELPDAKEKAQWEETITLHRMIHENVRKMIDSFQYDGHPMGMLMSAVSALSSFYPDARELENEEIRRTHIHRLIAKMPTIAAFIYRRKVGLPYIYPNDGLSYPANFLHMMFRVSEPEFEIHPALERAIDVLFILHADHEQNCSTNSIRSVGSSRPDPYCATAAAIGALAGPLHGGANEAVLRMLSEIGTVSAVPGYVERVKKGEFRLMGFGHRVYKNYDPRAEIIKNLAQEVFEVTGSNPLLDIALELERIALEDDYFVSRKLYPNVDFYSGLIYQSIGFPTAMFPVLFATARTSGWVSQWEEMLLDSEQKIARPRQIYIGPDKRDVPS